MFLLNEQNFVFTVWVGGSNLTAAVPELTSQALHRPVRFRASKIVQMLFFAVCF